MSEQSETGTDRVMVDIETLGRDPDAAIVSLGAVRFDTFGLGTTFERSVDLQSCEAADRHIEADTLAWWLDQDDAAREQLTGGEPLAEVLEDFVDWYGDAEEIWANSPSFDCAILADACEAVGVPVPWAFWQERDFRTLKNLPVAAEMDHGGVEHDALHDAIHQATVASETLARLHMEGER